MVAWDHKLMASLLLSVLSFVLVMGILSVFLILHFRHRQALFKLSGTEAGGEEPKSPVVCCKHLKRPNRWLAIKNRDLPAVQAALALHNPKPCSWLDGLAGNADRKVFVFPPVSGWVLVIGPALPEPSDDVDACFHFLADLSRKLGHIQYFSSNGILDHHSWVQSESGRVLRAYAWAGRTLWNQGKVTPAETELGMKCYDYEETAEVLPFNSADPGPTNSEKLHLLAARWSVDPEEIDERFIEQERGVVGEPSRLF